MHCNHKHSFRSTTPPPDKDVVKRAARGRWHEVLTKLDIAPSYLTGRHVACPGCGGKDRFRFDNREGDGTFICSQGTGVVLVGDGIELIRHVTDLPFPIVLRRVAQILGLDRSGVIVVPKPRAVVSKASVSVPTPGSADTTHLERILAQCSPVSASGTVARYLSARGLAEVLPDLPPSLYEHPALPYYEDAKKVAEYPAMVAPVHSPDGQLVCLHRTYLAHSGDAKAPVAQPKKLTRVHDTGKTIGGAIRLYAADDQVALTEGIESALAVRLMWGWPVWACSSANGLRTVQLPSGITAVRIYGDSDDAGMSAALYAMNWLRGEGRCVEWIHSARTGMDPLDVWNETHGIGVPR
jgi:putative DNA primase/helicase